MLPFHFIRHWLRAGNAHAIHSPFVYRLYTEVIRQQTPYYCYELLETDRFALHAAREVVEVQDFGAGAARNRRRRLGDIARRSEKRPELAQLLFRLVNHLQPRTLFDLGTCLGTTTLYLAHGCPTAALYTFEGDPGLAGRARQRFERFGMSHIVSVTGNLDATLPETLRSVDRLDFAFLDANHRREPTLRYLEQCLAKAHEGSVFVLDDIYWSGEMRQAWAQVQAHPAVTLTIDLFHLGLVFFRERGARQHFRLRA